MRDGQPEILGLLAGERDDLGDLLSRELGLGACTVTIAQDVDDEVLQVGVGDGLQLSGVEQVHRLCESATPSADALSVDAQCHLLLDSEVAIGGGENDLGALDDAVLRCRGPDEMLKHRALPREKGNHGGMTRHPEGMIRNAATEKRRYLRRKALTRFALSVDQSTKRATWPARSAGLALNASKVSTSAASRSPVV